MAVGYHRLNSSAARSRIRAGRPASGQAERSDEMPEWMTRNAIFRPGDHVNSRAFGAGCIMEFALTRTSPVRVQFDCGEKLMTVDSLSLVEDR